MVGAGALTASLPASAQSVVTRSVSVLDFVPEAERLRIVAGTSTHDCATAFAAAIKAAAGSPVHVPTGRYVIRSTVRVIVAGPRPFVAGPQLVGDGVGRSVIVAAQADGPVFDIDSDADHAREFKGVMGTRFEGLSILGQGGGRGGGIRMRSCYNAVIRQVHLFGLGGDGITIPCKVRDNDGSNMVRIDQVRIENCKGWGINAAGDPGYNEISFLLLSQVFIQGCGTASAAPVPTSGGMRYKGQIVTLDQCAFTINENVAFYVPGEAGLAQSIEFRGTAFENNKRRHILCTGVSGFKARNIQFYNNDPYSAEVACEFSGAANTVRFVDIDGAVVRATAGNARITAFRISGVHAETANCRVRNVIWENFDHPGQKRFDGFAFDPVDNGASLVLVEPSVLLLKAAKGRSVPLRLRGRGSTSGEWIAGQIPAGGVALRLPRLKAGQANHVYLFDNDGVMAMELSPLAPMTDPASGYALKPDDPTRFYVGRVHADAGGKALEAIQP